MVKLKTYIDTLRQGWQAFSVKAQKVNILGFVGHMVSVVMQKPCLCSSRILFIKIVIRPKLSNPYFKGKTQFCGKLDCPKYLILRQTKINTKLNKIKFYCVSNLRTGISRQRKRGLEVAFLFQLHFLYKKKIMVKYR